MRFLLPIFLASPLLAAQFVTLQWDANPEPDIASYAVHWGVQPRTYSVSTNVGNVTRAAIVIPGSLGIISRATNYLAVTALTTNGLESDFSNELTNVAPVGPPTHAILCSGIESADTPDGPWTEVLSTYLPITIESNKFYRPKMDLRFPPMPVEGK